MSTYQWTIDLGKRNTKCRGKKCFYDGNIRKGVVRISKAFENPNSEFKQQHYFHIDCYLFSTLSQKESTERLTSDKLPEVTGWSEGELDDDLRERVLKFFTDWEAGNHKIRLDPDSATKDEEEEEEEEGEEEKEKTGKKRKAKGKTEKPAKKKPKTEQEKLEEIKEAESEHVYMENTSENHNKFYEVWTKGPNLVTRYGSIAAYDKSSVHVKKVDSEEKAKSEMEKTIKQKTSKGKGYSKVERAS